MDICKKENCTGCGACAFVCPKMCISMQEDTIGVMYPVVDSSKCVQCRRCTQVCPQLSTPEYNRPVKAYAAWSADSEERTTSASGGIAAEIYKFASDNNMMFVGTLTNENFSVELTLTDNIARLSEFKNSKYVFSMAYKLYPQIKTAIKENKTTIVIGLPCQIAAVKKLFKSTEQFIFIDLVCHGTTPTSYLKQHIQKLNKELNAYAKKISFRDPEPGTEKYFFSLFDVSGKKFYSKRTADGDTYQYGYHRMISYRENCYHCLYARSERISDITLSDYKGLGKLKPCEYDEKKVSCVLINTEKGQEIINTLMIMNRIIAEERPVEEPLQGDKQLQHPSQKDRRRIDFEKYIVKTNADFEKTMCIVMWRAKVRSFLRKLIGR
ncbi:Coenzyme F420 hydrogenase/dehydrogenase, beta subunit C-terminal domain [Mediterraneibacter faecis]|uniref:Coenzyme F420 hydrogenase/dehydrogenase, beta subunit C-terminal domain n=1 Tax=Mediterraneibacter faecis TaxID=592978 RepID=UPI003F95C16A